LLACAGGLALSLVPLSAGARSVGTGLEAGDLAPSTAALARVARVGVPALIPTPVPVTGVRYYYPWSIPNKLRDRSTDPGLGGDYGGIVLSSSGSTMWSERPTVGYLPASNNKLVTAYVALRSLGSTTRITTTATMDPAAPWYVYLKGAGDPSLDTSRMTDLANQTATALKAIGRSAITLRFDDTLFPSPTNAPGWKTSYVPSEVAPVRALVVDSHNVTDTSKDAATVLAGLLGKRGITVRSVYRATSPATATVIASTSSPTVGQLVAAMLNVSQNDYAEALFRLAAKARGYQTTWTGAHYNAISVLSTAGVPTSGWVSYDGSGLSRSDRLPTVTAAGLVRVMDTDATLRGIVFSSGGLPIAGLTGTLVSRFTTAPTSCARGIIQAKTGSLDDVTALSGVAVGMDGQRRYFSILVNGKANTSATRDAVDRLAATATGCY